jgi:hypothetical protein
VILARGLLGTAGPVLAAEKSTDRIAALASYAVVGERLQGTLEPVLASLSP